MNDKVVSMFGASDPRVDTFLHEVKDLIYERAAGVFPLATVLGVLRVIENDLIEEMKND